jgi:GntR family transcriptional regulator, transcriptional repressor for pyruvate dehydrogenase complex
VLSEAEVRPPSSESRRAAASPMNRDRVAYRVARDIATWLLDAGLPDGTRLPPEQDLCAKLGLSRMGLRSALRLLESWGLVTIQTGRNGGPVVRSPQVGDLKDTLSLLIHVERATISDVLVARRVIAPIVTAAAAVNATPQQSDDLALILDRIRKPNITQRELLSATSEFQTVLSDASRMAILGLFLKILVSFGELSMMQRLPIDEEWRQQVLTSFERIHRAVSEHDEEGARAAMALHRSESDRFWNTRESLAHVPLGPFEFGR